MIYGDRIRLRPVEREDLPRFVKWFNDLEVRDALAMIYPLGLAQEERWFESNLKADRPYQVYAIDALPGLADVMAAPGTWTHIGSTGFHDIDWRNQWGEIGIAIGDKDFWNQGFGTDAVRTLVRFGFNEMNLNRIRLRVYEDNARAIRCYEKVGFQTEGRLRQDRFHNGRYYDTLIMGLLRKEFWEKYGQTAHPAAAGMVDTAPAGTPAGPADISPKSARAVAGRESPPGPAAGV